MRTEGVSLPGTTTSESEYRERVLRAVAALRLEGGPITLRRLRGAGVTGEDRRIIDTARDLVLEGYIPAHVWNEDRDKRTTVDPALVRAKQASEAAARAQSAEWVAEHDARWRRIRHKGRKTDHTNGGCRDAGTYTSA